VREKECARGRERKREGERQWRKNARETERESLSGQHVGAEREKGQAEDGTMATSFSAP